MKKFKSIIAVVLTVVLVFSLFGCSNGNTSTHEDNVVTWYLPGILDGNDRDLVMDTVNQKLQEKYGLKLNMVFIDGGNYTQKLQVINSSREVYDLCFTSNWTNDFQKGISNGCWYDISKDLDKLAPNTKKSVSEGAWKATTYDGAVYAVPNFQVQAKSSALNIPKENLELTGWKIEDINNMEDLEAFMKDLHAVAPERNKLGSLWNSLLFYYGLEEIVGAKVPAAIYFNKEGKPVVVNQFATPEFKEYVTMRRSWVEQGLITDLYNDSKTSSSSAKVSGPFAVHIYKPGGEAEINAKNTIEYRSKQFSDALLSYSGIAASMTAVSATSKNPQNALKMIEIMQSDKEIYNLLAWGIEGKHYKKVSDNKIEVIANSGYEGISDWSFGSIANSFIPATKDDDVIEQTKKFNDEAVVSPVLGMNFDISRLESEVSNCITVINEQLEMLELGLRENPDQALNKMLKDLETAGVDRLISELQKQVDAWWANK